MRIAIFFSAIIFIIILNLSFKPTGTSKHFTIQQLAPGVWAAINNDNYGHAICNAGIVDLGDKTLVYDPFMNLDAAIDLKRIAKKLTNKEATIIINSHYNNDHIRGNQVFVPASIISSNYTRGKIMESEPKELAWEKTNAPTFAAREKDKLKNASPKEKEEITLWIGYYEAMVINGPNTKTTLPTLTFNDSLWIHGSNKSVLLVEYKNGHTKSDVVLKIPKDGVVFMGDLLFTNRHPYLGHGIPAKWINHLDEMIADDNLKQYLPGHGGVSNKADVKAMRDYIVNVQQLVTNSYKRNQPNSLIKKLAITAAYTNWKFGRFFPLNLNFLTKHLKRE